MYRQIIGHLARRRVQKKGRKKQPSDELVPLNQLVFQIDNIIFLKQEITQSYLVTTIY